MLRRITGAMCGRRLALTVALMPTSSTIPEVWISAATNTINAQPPRKKTHAAPPGGRNSRINANEEAAESLTRSTLRDIAGDTALVAYRGMRFGKLRRSFVESGMLKHTAGRILPLEPNDDPMRVFVARVRDLCNVPDGADKSAIPHMAVVGIGGMGKTELLWTIRSLDRRVNESARMDPYWADFCAATKGISGVGAAVKEAVVMFATFGQEIGFDKFRETAAVIVPRNGSKVRAHYLFTEFTIFVIACCFRFSRGVMADSVGFPIESTPIRSATQHGKSVPS